MLWFFSRWVLFISFTGQICGVYMVTCLLRCGIICGVFLCCLFFLGFFCDL